MTIRYIAQICIFFCLLPLGAIYGQDATFKVTEVTAFPLSNSVSPRIFPAPDGIHVAYERAVRLNGHRDYYLCVADASSAEPICGKAPLPLPSGFEPDPNALLIPFSWSPDSTHVAAVGQPLGTQNDTDLWIMDAATAEWRNLTDDGYTEALSSAPPGVTIELQPAWSPDGETIAVESSTIAENGGWESTVLNLIDVESGERRVLPLPGSTEGTQAGSTSGINWSPDGSRLAVSLRHAELSPALDGLWLIDVTNGENQQIVNLETAQSAFSALYPDVPLSSIGPAIWSPDGTRLLLWLGDPNKKPAVARPFWYVLESGSLTPVPVALLEDGSADKRVRPIQAAWSPDGSKLLALTFGFPREETLNPLGAQVDSPRLSLRLIDVTSGAEQVLGHLPLGPSSALYFAAWGSKGDAIFNGYHLTLEGN